MTDVAFYVNVPDPVAFTCRLLRKARSRGLTVLVLGQAKQLVKVDGLLWSMHDSEFLPHCRAGAAPGVLARSPIVLTNDMAHAPKREFAALLNLSSEVPTGYRVFGRLFEVVSMTESELLAARHRWRAYQTDGLTPERHEIGA